MTRHNLDDRHPPCGKSHNGRLDRSCRNRILNATVDKRNYYITLTRGPTRQSSPRRHRRDDTTLSSYPPSRTIRHPSEIRHRHSHRERTLRQLATSGHRNKDRTGCPNKFPWRQAPETRQIELSSALLRETRRCYNNPSSSQPSTTNRHNDATRASTPPYTRHAQCPNA